MKRLYRALSCLAVPLVVVATALPGAAAPAPSAPRGDEAVPLTAETAQEFLDTRVAELLEEHGAPGVAAAVVSGSEQIAAASHGYADLAEQTPLDHTRHTFPAASVSKSFTAAAVLTLVEQGELDLHEDVNAYLPEEARLAPAPGGEPVTLHHLLTHTAGFAEVIDMPRIEETHLHRTLEEAVVLGEPEYLFSPGEFAAYSNHGTAVAGYVVESVSGMPFEDYVAEHVFAPLGMDGSEFVQIDDAREVYDIPLLYTPDGSRAEEIHVSASPAGAAMVTADDMSAFMLALLNGGEAEGGEGLPAGVVEAMTARQYEAHPETTAMGYGAYEWRAGDSPAVGHAGDLLGLHTAYVVLPELDAGVYVAVNGDDSAEAAGGNPLLDLRMAVVEDFMDTFAPQAAAEGTADPGADLGALEGTYVSTRRAAEGPAQIIALFDNLVVRDAGDGTLSLSGLTASDDRWLPLGDGRFSASDGSDVLAVVGDASAPAALVADSNPTNAYERTTLADSPITHAVVAVSGLLVLLTAAVPFQRRGNRWTLAARVLLSLTALACFTGVGLLLYGLTNSAALESWVIGGSPALTAPLAVAVPLALAGAALTAVSLAKGWLRPLARVHLSLAVLASAAVLALGFRYGLVWLPF
ncbi:serine hydrolase domain-containing protein [Nocardiopsis algeriensis]|uniref:serine hydrolase domain-containing protein n=1 Tax=Nocardiopsis algeriensis TaxID=1478215 RepID=UPI003B428917